MTFALARKAAIYAMLQCAQKTATPGRTHGTTDPFRLADHALEVAFREVDLDAVTRR